MIWWWVIQLIIAIVMAVVSYLITPRPDAKLSNALDGLDTPTAEAGKEIPVIFGTVTVKSLNTLWVGEKGQRKYKVKVGGK